MEPDKKQTMGELRVRASFNPAQDSTVDEIKRLAAELIDLAELCRELDPRLVSLAQTAFEEGAMWAVKAATTPKPQDNSNGGSSVATAGPVPSPMGSTTAPAPAAA